jgi:predicted RNA-binding protein with PUA-like domain
MRDQMQPGDLALFYHSNGTPTEPTGVYGVVQVASKAHTDETQFDTKDEHYDAKSKKDAPLWQCVDMAFVEQYAAPVTLAEIKGDPKLAGMAVRERGSRLSIQPVSEKHFTYIQKLASQKK